MRQSSALKQEIEARLASIPSALSPQASQPPRFLPTGSIEVDALLGGGFPMGAISEVSGPVSSGRTSLCLSLLAKASEEAACAYIDVSDTLSPHSAAAAGVRLENLLWVRFAAGMEAGRMQRSATPSRLPEEKNLHAPVPHSGCGPHPRLEVKGLAPALEAMLAQKAETRLRKMQGTPGFPNQQLGLGQASQEQVDWERFNARKADATDPLRQLDLQAMESARRRTAAAPAIAGLREQPGKPWNLLDRAIRAADQVLQSGGFRAVVLDLASVAPEQALRIPAATWFRFRRAAKESDAVLLLLTQVPCAQSSAACGLGCAPGGLPAVNRVLPAFRHTAYVTRQRVGQTFERKMPGRVSTWSAAPVWMRAVGR